MRRGVGRGIARAALGVCLGIAVAAPARAVLVFDAGAPGFTEEVAVSGLPFLTAVAFAPDGRIFLTLKSGVVRVVENGSLLPTPFIDLTNEVNDHHDRGLLGVAVHPDFPDTPYLYLLYTYDPPQANPNGNGGRVSRLLRVEADPAQNHNVALAIPGSRVVLLGTNSTFANIGNHLDGRDITKPSCMTGASMAGAPIRDCLPSDENSHSIGTVTFASDGSLFVGSGDGSNYTNVDPRALRAQLPDSLAGKIMRIDPITGLGLADNPSYEPGDPGSNLSKVWASGLRNPFRFTVRPGTNDAFVGDVGWNDWEEINSGEGANFGWPCYEGGVVSGGGHEGGNTTSRVQVGYRDSTNTAAACAALYAQGAAAVKRPLFSYDHVSDSTGAGGGAAAGAGAFYTGTVYPEAYQGALFISDFARQWVRYLTFDEAGNATVHNFARENAEEVSPVQVLVGPDTNLYVVLYRSTGSELRRIRYTAGGNTPPTAVVGATPTVGTAPMEVQFSSIGSFDPDAQVLSSEWDFADGDTSTEAEPVHTFTEAGVYDVELTVREETAPHASDTQTVRITVGNEPPLATISDPTPGSTYAIGDGITYSGSATSGGIPVDPSQLAWELRLHHNQHVHFDSLDPGAGGTLVVEEHGDATFLELCLTATVPPDLTDTRCVTLEPERTDYTIASEPPGALITYEDEGVALSAPAIIQPIVNSQQTITAPLVQLSRTFVRWSDGETQRSRAFVTGTTPVTYTAIYENQDPVAALDAVPTSGGPAPLVVDFDGSGSTDPEGDALTYDWDFGDGAADEGAVVSHPYSATGPYTAVLTVTDSLGGEASAQAMIDVIGDGDGDGVLDSADNCPARANADQSDLDSDQIGDVCDGHCLVEPTSLASIAPTKAPPGNTIQLFASGVSPNASVLFGGVPSPYIDRTAGALLARIPDAAAVGSTLPVEVVNPEGCRSQEWVSLEVVAPAPFCGLLGVELLALPAWLLRRRTRRTR